nr:hypothetical protein [Haloplanus natans]
MCVRAVADVFEILTENAGLHSRPVGGTVPNRFGIHRRREWNQMQILRLRSLDDAVKSVEQFTAEFRRRRTRRRFDLEQRPDELPFDARGRVD